MATFLKSFLEKCALFLQRRSQHAAHAQAYSIDGGAGGRSYVNMQKCHKNYFVLQSISNYNVSFLIVVAK